MTSVAVFESVRNMNGCRALVQIEFGQGYRDRHHPSAKFYDREVYPVVGCVSLLKFHSLANAVKSKERNRIGKDPLFDATVAIVVRRTPEAVTYYRGVVLSRIVVIFCAVCS